MRIQMTDDGDVQDSRDIKNKRLVGAVERVKSLEFRPGVYPGRCKLWNRSGCPRAKQVLWDMMKSGDWRYIKYDDYGYYYVPYRAGTYGVSASNRSYTCVRCCNGEFDKD